MLVLLIIVVSCKQDDTILTGDTALNDQDITKSTVKNVAAQEIPEVIDFIKSVSNKEMSFTINTSEDTTKNHEEDLILTTVLTDQIQQVTNSAGKSNYTFKMQRISNFTGTYFLNLVVKEYKDTFYTYIVKYVPDTNWLISNTATTSFNSFTGSIYYYTSDGTYMASAIINNGTSTTTTTKDLCNSTGGGSQGGGGNTDNNDGGGEPSGGTTGSGGGSTSSCITTISGHICNVADLRPDCSSTSGGVITVTVACTLGEKSLSKHLRDPCTPETECHNEVGDPCSCNASGDGCEEDTTEDEEEENNEVGINIDVDEVSRRRECRKLQNLSSSPSFQQRIQELIDNNSGNTEKGSWGRIDGDDTMQYEEEDNFEGLENVLEIRPPVPQDPIDSYVHNHFTKTDPNTGVVQRALPIFSGGDIYTLFSLYNAGRIADLSDFVMVVTTPGTDVNDPADDTLYAITVSSTLEFQSVANVFGSTLDFIDTFFDRGKYAINPNTDVSINEEHMSKFFNDKKMGLNIYRGDINDLTSWELLETNDQGEFSENNCD